MKVSKTNAARQLDAQHITYTLHTYEVDESDLSAPHVAQQLGEPVEQVFKTLVLEGDVLAHFVCVVPGAKELDLKRVAQLTGNKRCSLVHQRELLPLTGYVRGGCSPIGMKKPFPTFIDQSAEGFPQIYISAGQRGLQLCLSPADLIKVCHATTVPLCADGDTEHTRP